MKTWLINFMFGYMGEQRYEVKKDLVYEVIGFSPEQIRGNFWSVLFSIDKI